MFGDGKVGVRGDDLEGGAAVAQHVLLGRRGAVVLGRVGAQELEIKGGQRLVQRKGGSIEGQEK